MQKTNSSSETTRIEVDVSEFSRGEIAIKLRRNNTILVHALHLDQYAVDNFFRKELVKTFHLPPGADVERIRSIIRNTGILTIDIPMMKDDDSVQNSEEQSLQTVDESVKQQVNSRQSNLHVNVNINQSHEAKKQTTLTGTRRAVSLGNIKFREYSQTAPKFNIADFLHSDFRPRFAQNGKKIILKVDTRGYESDELVVRLLDSNLLVQGKKKSFSTFKNNQTKQFSQSIRLPDGVDKFNVTSQVMDNGILVIDVPLLNSVIY